MKIKKILAMTLALALSLTSFAGCSSTTDDAADTSADTSADASAEDVDAQADFEEAETVLGTSAYPGTSGEGSVTINLGFEPPEMNSLIATYGVAFTVNRHINTNLVTLDENTNVTEGVAESWEISEDGLNYTFHLREGMTWSNGEPVTANDFLFAWEKLLDPATASEYAYFGFMFKNAEAFYNGECTIDEVGFKAPDDYTIEVTLENPTAYALYLFTFGSLTPVNEKFYNEVGADKYATDVEYFCTNGAFNITEWVHDSHIVIEKNPNWYRADEVSLDSIKFVMITDEATALTAFQAGEVDMVEISGDQLKIMQGEGYPVSSFPTGQSYHLYFNTENEYLSNVNLRKAFDLAYSRQDFIDYVLEDYSLPAHSMVSPTVNGFDGTPFCEAVEAEYGVLVEPAGNPDLAKEYLATAMEELGCTIEDLQENIKISCSDDGAYQKQATYIQEQFRVNLGLELGVTVMTASAISEDRVSGNYTIMTSRWGPDYNDPMTFLDMWVTGGGNNAPRWSNADYDALIESAALEPDLEKRQGYFLEAEKLLADEAPVSTYYWASSSYVVSGKMTGGYVRVGFQSDYRFTTIA